jgi:hypothetical protein
LEQLVRRCVASYPDARDMAITIKSLPGQTPNWDCVVKYGSPITGAGDSLVREVAALKHRFHLAE